MLLGGRLQRGTSVKRSARFTVLLAMLAAFVFSGAQSAFAATLAVPQDFVTVQAAVLAASAGDTIHVYPGVYNTGTYVIADKPGLSIIGVDSSGVPITSAADVAATVSIT